MHQLLGVVYNLVQFSFEMCRPNPCFHLVVNASTFTLFNWVIRVTIELFEPKKYVFADLVVRFNLFPYCVIRLTCPW